MMESARDRLALLATINTVQPVKLEELEQNVPKHVDVKKLIEDLIKNGYLRKTSQDQYVVSQLGLRSVHHGLRKNRDIRRMLFLIDASKKG